MITIILYLVILVLLEASAIDMISRWKENRHSYFLFYAVILYITVALFFAFILKDAPSVTVTNSLWQSLNIIIITMMGLLLYKDKLSTIQLTGLVFAILAVIITTSEDLILNFFYK
jgi:multidrug transporter EmrE-like cation transporter